MNTELSYLTYLAISIVLTIWVARTLSKNGEVFLVKCFGQDEILAKSTNHLLVVGFYLINIGFIALRLDGWSVNGSDLIPYVTSKIGVSALTPIHRTYAKISRKSLIELNISQFSLDRLMPMAA